MTAQMDRQVARQIALVDHLHTALADLLGNAAPTKLDILDAMATVGLTLQVDTDATSFATYQTVIRQAAGSTPRLQVVS